MTIKELHSKSNNRSRCSPDSLFEADTGSESLLLCLAEVDLVVSSDASMKEIFQKYPNYLDWIVTKEHFTEQELRDRKSV